MSKIRSLKGGGLVYHCPGCGEKHQINSRATGARWKYNGDAGRPTFSPSVLYTSGHYVEGEQGKDCWCTFEERLPQYRGRRHPACYRCHSFVRAGAIEFLRDSTHALAGQTVEMPDWPHAPGEYAGVEEPGPAAGARP